MRKYLVLGCVCAGLAGGGYYYYARPFQAPPPPTRDLTKILPRKLLETAGPAQIAVLKGESDFAPKEGRTEKTAVAAKNPAGNAAPAREVIAGLTIILKSDTMHRLRGRADNSTDQAITWGYPAGITFSNGIGNVVLLKSASVQVPPHYFSELELPIAVTSSENGVLEGSFSKHGSADEKLQGLVRMLDGQHHFSADAAQTAVLALTEDVPLDVVSPFPRVRPLALSDSLDHPFRVSSSDLIEGLDLLREAGVSIEQLSMMADPQLKIMSLLDPMSHAAAMRLFGITEQNAWDYWRGQLLQGDPALRHYALYGIARYYPDVALVMLPQWVRAKSLYRNFRLSAAWALALIEDARAQKELLQLQRETNDDPGLKQAIGRALRHWNAGSGTGKVASATF